MGVGTALGRFSIDLNIWRTHVNDDLPGGVCDGMDRRLRGRFSAGKEVRPVAHIAYLILSPKVENTPKTFKPLLSGLLWLTKRSRVIRVTIVLVQALRDVGQVPLSESRTPFVHEFDLWGVRVCWIGHWGEAAEGSSSEDVVGADRALTPGGYFTPVSTLPPSSSDRTDRSAIEYWMMTCEDRFTDRFNPD